MCDKRFDIGLILIVLIIVRGQDSVESVYCDEDNSIQLGPSDYVIYLNRSLFDLKHGILYDPSLYHKTGIDGVYRVCVCQVRTCIRKCCKRGEAYNKTCVPSNSSLVHPFNPMLYDKGNNESGISIINNQNYFLLTGFPSCVVTRNKYAVDPRLDEDDQFLILKSGILFLERCSVPEYDISNYCLEAVLGQDENGADSNAVLPLLCFPPMPEPPPTIYKIGQMVSIPFLLVTFLVYACIPEMRNYHGKCLMCYVLSLMAAFSSLSFAQFQLFTHLENICFLVAFLIQFSFLATFFWLNAMCFDIWWTFSGCKAFRGALRDGTEERTKFIICSLYAWGAPFAICCITAYINFSETIPQNWIRPNFGLHKCWFDDGISELVYFYAPISALLSLNVIMFVLTTCKIVILKRETSALKNKDSKRHAENDRQRFFLYLKLFALMGVNWIMEVISKLTGDSNTVIWVITDLCDTLEGVVIFFLFVCTKNTLKLLSRKMCSSLELFKDGSTKGTSSSKLVSMTGSGKERVETPSKDPQVSKERDSVSLRTISSD